MERHRAGSLDISSCASVVKSIKQDRSLPACFFDSYETFVLHKAASATSAEMRSFTKQAERLSLFPHKTTDHADFLKKGMCLDSLQSSQSSSRFGTCTPRNSFMSDGSSVSTLADEEDICHSVPEADLILGMRVTPSRHRQLYQKMFRAGRASQDIPN